MERGFLAATTRREHLEPFRTATRNSFCGFPSEQSGFFLFLRVECVPSERRVNPARPLNAIAQSHAHGCAAFPLPPFSHKQRVEPKILLRPQVRALSSLLRTSARPTSSLLQLRLRPTAARRLSSMPAYTSNGAPRKSPPPAPTASIPIPMDVDVDEPAAPVRAIEIPKELGNFHLVTEVQLGYSPTKIVKWQSQETGLKVVWIDVEGAPFAGESLTAKGGVEVSPLVMQDRSCRATLRS